MVYKIYFSITLLIIYYNSSAQGMRSNVLNEVADVYIIEDGSHSRITDSILYLNVDSLSKNKFVFVPVSNLQKERDSNLMKAFKSKYIGIGIIEDLNLELRYLQSLLKIEQFESPSSKVQTLDSLVELSIGKLKSIKDVINFFIEHKDYLYNKHFGLFIILQNIELSVKWYGSKDNSKKTLYNFTSNSSKFIKYCNFLCEGVISFYKIDSSFRSSILIDFKSTDYRKISRKLQKSKNLELDYINLSAVMKAILIDSISGLNIQTVGILYDNSIYDDWSKLYDKDSRYFYIEVYAYDFLNSGLKRECIQDSWYSRSIKLENCNYDNLLKINLSDYTFRKYIQEISPLFKIKR